MGIRIREEHDIPEGRLRSFAAPLEAADSTWYLAAETGDRWLVASVHPVHEAQVPGQAHWHVSWRGRPDADLAAPLTEALMAHATHCECNALVTEPVPLPGPMDDCLRRVAFQPFCHVQRASAPTSSLPACFVGGTPASGLAIRRLADAPLVSVMALFRAREAPLPASFGAAAGPLQDDCSYVLMNGEQAVAAIIGRVDRRGAEVFRFVSSPRWEEHKGTDAMLHAWSRTTAARARHCTFVFREGDGDMEALAARVNAQMLLREVRHWRAVAC